VGGWVLLLAITFAATHVAAINKGGGGAVPVIEPALSTGLAKLVLDISTVGQLFAGWAALRPPRAWCSRSPVTEPYQAILFGAASTNIGRRHGRCCWW
jgi:hypothetical protein